jgi:hypothetical protein
MAIYVGVQFIAPCGERFADGRNLLRPYGVSKMEV